MKTLDELLANVPPEKLDKIRKRFEELRDRGLEQKLWQVFEELEKAERKHYAMTIENAIMTALREYQKWLDGNLDRVKDMTEQERIDLFFEEMMQIANKPERI